MRPARTPVDSDWYRLVRQTWYHRTAPCGRADRRLPRLRMSAHRHVLIAEADDSVRSLLARLVARHDPTITLTLATDGAAVLAALERCEADLLITSHRLPTLSGLGLIQTLRARTVTIPIVLLSSD